uniref:MobA-like NTP transferase domain-containing protein n=1 Tax=uncultured organism TaxID=155900 RepID=M1QBZ8_9ZZZZ|nr:hypothetical protein FLSS-28_0021 [uncultured organism]
MRADVLVLAGAQNKGPLRKYSSVEHEALIKIADRPMIEYVIRAVNTADKTGKIAVVGPRKEIERSIDLKVDMIVEASTSLIENIRCGVNNLKPKHHLLLISSDIPLITAEVIDEFIASCENKKADIYFPIVSREHSQAKFPGVKRTYVDLAEGSFTGGNLVLIKPEVLVDSLAWLEKAFTLRKKPFKLSRLLGPKIVFKFLMGNLSLEEIENRVYKILGYRGKGLITEHPEIGFDVDKPSDLKLMREKYK